VLGSSLSNSTRRKKEKAMMVVWSQMKWSISNHWHYHSNIG
jgi:hypothetical protein